MVTPIEITALPTYTAIPVTAANPIGTNLLEAACLASRKGVTFRNRGPSNLYITSAAAEATDYLTLEPGDSVVYVFDPVVGSLAFYFAVPASGATTIEREEWL